MNNNDTWQPIETAPTDGTVILTDDGLVRFNEYRGMQNGAGLYPCYINGALVDDSDYGGNKSFPKWWMPIPPIPADK